MNNSDKRWVINVKKGEIGNAIINSEKEIKSFSNNLVNELENLLSGIVNNSDKRFSIISGIVDTDTYNSPINFPFIINKKIIEDNEILIKQGTPYVQVIPFKRKNWKMKIEEISKEKLFSFNLNFKSIIYQNYKNKIWKKKNYK